MGGEDFAEYSLPDHSIPAVDFTSAPSIRKNRAVQEGRKRIAEFAFEQVAPVRNRPFASDHRYDQRVLDLMKK